MLTLDQLAEGPGKIVTPEYVRQRMEIEARHGANDDGTETYFARVHGARSEYADNLPEPVGESSPIHVLAYYGLGVRHLELLDRNGCETISDVRDALAKGDVLVWKGTEKQTEMEIQEAVDFVYDIIGANQVDEGK